MRISYAMLWRLCYPVINEELLKNSKPGNEMIGSVFSGNVCGLVPTWMKLGEACRCGSQLGGF